MITSYDIATRDIDALATVAWDRLHPRRGAGREEPRDEACARAAPPQRAAHARDDREPRSRTASTSCGRSWTSSTPACSARASASSGRSLGPIEARSDSLALERLRAMVQPFILRRPKDSPEVELELPEITVTKEYCRLTLEQASLYRATVDRWMPRIEEHERSFGRRGAVLAMLSQLKQVCNHPEMLLATGRPLEGRSGQARAPRRAARGDAGRRQGARLHPVPGVRPARAPPPRAPRPRDRVLPRRPARPRSATSSSRRSRIPTARRCS